MQDILLGISAQADMPFESVGNIMRNVNYECLIRYIQSCLAHQCFSLLNIYICFLVIIRPHINHPRELLWFFGIFIFVAMMATAFMGYVLPWGQMSFWGATVITNLFSAIPVVGDALKTWLWGGFAVGNPTLNRFFALHYLLPFIILGLSGLHVIALHQHGSNNPTGLDVKTEKDTIPFHPYYTVKDFFGFGVFFLIFAYMVFFMPNTLGHPDNYIPANPMVTPPHIVPEWYFLPFYAILRAIPNKLLGVLAMFGAIVILFFLPWLDSSKVRSGTYRPWFRILYWVFIADCFLLGYVGANQPEGINVFLGAFGTLYYFAHFIVILPLRWNI